MSLKLIILLAALTGILFGIIDCAIYNRKWKKYHKQFKKLNDSIAKNVDSIVKKLKNAKNVDSIVRKLKEN